ncbi:MAG: MtnX-like HAD-IB family phosphatase [Candidatus Omnitrophica bacterium]|nr:MtnX-like HAD-IB family phosphatase [Candidatus Omnitrophota bacterium]MDD5653272.1 MtnX-like HAD-IB family phosphatase [Candidatus Omnitrophota bacterium]
MQRRLSSISDCRVFFDFDNTLTPFDVLDDIVKRFSINKGWVSFEQAWKKGKIGSQACLEGQLRSVRVNRKDLVRYLSRIKIDPTFHKFFAMLKKEGLSPIILSDSFKFIIEEILKNNGIREVKVYANGLRFSGNRLAPFFPYRNQKCPRCAHCKKKNLLKKEVKDKIIMYVGDGLSDICPAECSDIVFAKGRLLRHFRDKKRLCVAFNSIEDIHNYFRGLGK